MIKYIVFSLALILQSASAVTFKIDYTYDTDGFFGDPNNPNDGLLERRVAIETVAEFLSELTQDEFLEIDASDNQFPQATWTPRMFHPSTGNIVNLPVDMVIPENEVIVFVGARDLTGNVVGSAGPGFFSASGFTSWFQRIRGRGQVGADSGTAADNNDFALWGGSVAFDTTNANGTIRNWNFSLTASLTGTDFVPVAIHELCHVLGIGSADSWDNLINANEDFSGQASENSLGSLPPVQPTIRGHFAANTSNSVAFGSFGTDHGIVQPAIMRPSLFSNNGRLAVLSDLDLAGLVDIGWEIQVPVAIDGFNVTGTPQVTFSWLTSSFVNYQVERTTDLVTYTDLGAEITGDGTMQTIVDNAPPADRAFYRIKSTAAFSNTNAGNLAQAALASKLTVKDPQDNSYRTIESKTIEPIECAICDECKGDH